LQTANKARAATSLDSKINRMPERIKPLRAPDLKARKKRGEKIAMLTAYDATMARLLDRAGIDVLLVGDSLGMVILGHETTLPVTLDDVLHHAKAVSRGARRALVVADMPFLTFQVSPAEAVRNAGRLLQEGGAAAVKIEGGRPVVDVVRRLVDVGIPVMGHLGLTPQAVHQLGGFRQQAAAPEDAERLLDDARALEAAGVFALVLESIPAELARAVTAALKIPTIGIGAGPCCDGQVLVSYDAFGLFDEFVPSFVKQYAHLAETIREAAREYIAEVKDGRFPAQEQPVVPVAANGKK
jgi:3-methyl-2-oxobutanoate hydroxymethyltransferase